MASALFWSKEKSKHGKQNSPTQAVRFGGESGSRWRHRLGFRGDASIRIHEGHDERSGHFTVGGGTGEHGQFQLSVDVSGASFQLDRLFVEVYEESANDGSEINKVIVPVIYGPRIVSGYYGYRVHVVRRGDTLSRIARENYGDPNRYHDIVRANPLVISNPDLIFPGQQLEIPFGT